MSYAGSRGSTIRNYEDKDCWIEVVDSPDIIFSGRFNSKKPLLPVFYFLLIITLCGSNIITFLSLLELKSLSQEPISSCKSRAYLKSNLDGVLTGMAVVDHDPRKEITQTIHTYTDYSSPDRRVTDDAWNKFGMDGFVALPNTRTEDAGQPKGREMTGEPNKSVYVVDAFHQMHCVMSIREIVSDILDGKEIANGTDTRRHLDHCYDTLRQSIMCHADPAPLYVPEDPFFAGDGQERQCRDWGKLEEWVLQHTAYNLS